MKHLVIFNYLKHLTAGKSREGANTPWQTSYLCTPQGNASGVSAWDYLLRHLKHAQTYIPWALLGCFPCSHIAWEKVYWTNHAGFPKFLFDFLSSNPHQAPSSHPCWVLPHTGKKKSRPAQSIQIGWEKKIPQTIYLDLIQANTHWFQGDFNFF